MHSGGMGAAKNCLVFTVITGAFFPDHLLSEEEELLASGLSDEQDPGGESFEKLFSRFAQMKGWCWLCSLLSRALS